MTPIPISELALPSISQENGRTVIVADSSSIVQFEKCPTFHDFVTVKSLMKKRESRAYMDRGTVGHGLLQRYYHRIWEGGDYLDAMDYALSQMNEIKKGMQLNDDDFKKLALVFTRYCIKYSKDKIKVATINGKPALEIGFSVPIVDNATHLFVLEGRIDMIVEMSGNNVIWDHKCQSRKYYLYEYAIQALNYTLASRTSRFMFNYVRLHDKEQEDTFQRDATFIGRNAHERWMKRLLEIFYSMAERQSQNNFIDKDWPRAACSDIGFGKVCPFHTVCQESELGVRNSQLRNNFMLRERWQPWSLEEVLESGE